MGLKICKIKLFMNRGQIRLRNGKTADLDCCYPRRNQKLKFLIRDLLMLFVNSTISVKVAWRMATHRSHSHLRRRYHAV